MHSNNLRSRKGERRYQLGAESSTRVSLQVDFRSPSVPPASGRLSVGHFTAIYWSCDKGASYPILICRTRFKPHVFALFSELGVNTVLSNLRAYSDGWG